VAETIEKMGMGWLPDYPDFRDYTIEQGEVAFIISYCPWTFPLCPLCQYESFGQGFEGCPWRCLQFDIYCHYSFADPPWLPLIQVA